MKTKKISEKINTKESKLQIDNLIRQAIALRQENSVKCIELSMQALVLAKKANYKKGIAECHYNIGIAHFNKSDFNSSLEHLHEAELQFSRLDLKKQIAETLNAIGVVNKSYGFMDNSLDSHLKALKIFNEIDDKKGMASANNNLGVLYKVQGEYSKALQYFEKALEIYRKAEETTGLIMALGNIANIYRQTGNDNKAIEYNMQALEIAERIGDKKNNSLIANNIGSVYEKQGNYGKALEYFKKSVALKESIGDTKGIASTYSNIGNLYRAIGEPDSALKYQKMALKLVHNANAKPLEKDIYKEISESFAKTGDYEQAYKNHLRFFQLHDELFSQEARNRLNEIITDYETEKSRKEAEIFRLKNVELKKKNKKIEEQRKLLAEEKRKSDELLLNILPYEIAEELKQKGYADAKQFDKVTVLFTDFKSFTTIAERLSARELVNEINECFSAFDKICDKYGVEKIKTIGDAYMAAGGLPVESENHAEAVVHAALEMRDYMAKKAKHSKGGGFSVRLGIHTGPVAAGIVGIKKFQYDIWGDTVNIASRMESSGEVGKVNISEATYRLVKNKFNCKFRGEIEAKNKGKLKMYFVERSKSQEL